MIKFQLRYGVIVSLNSTSPHESSPIAYEGNPVFVEAVRSTLSQQYGAFGHLIKDAATPIDLHSAMNKPEMQEFKPQLIEGEQLVQSYSPNIPDDATT